MVKTWPPVYCLCYVPSSDWHPLKKKVFEMDVVSSKQQRHVRTVLGQRKEEIEQTNHATIFSQKPKKNRKQCKSW
jgi:hypothetical protein